MKQIRLSLRERSYSIFVGKELLKNAGSLFKKEGVGDRTAVIVSQKQIAVYYQKMLQEALTTHDIQSVFYTVPYSKSSEAAKSQARQIGRRLFGAASTIFRLPTLKNAPSLLVGLP